jgi:hypothetical protein
MFSMLLSAVILILAGVLVQTLQQQDKLKKALYKYETLSDREKYQKRLESDINFLESDINAKKNELISLDSQKDTIHIQVRKLKQQLSNFEEEEHIQSFGFYKPKYDLISSDDYAIQLKNIELQQKQMIKNETAAICGTPWVVKDSRKEGKKMEKSFIKLVLTTFNIECEGILIKVKHSNIIQSEDKIIRSFKKLNKLSEVTDCNITQDYLELKIRELQIKYEMECKRQEEREFKQAVIQENKQRDSVEKARREIEVTEEREQQHLQELEQFQRDILQLEGEKRNQLELKIKQLEQQVSQDINDKENAISRSKMIKSGIIFVISNIGSLGRDVYRLSMTKSSKPDEYISTMTPIVPFPFDVHLKIFSEDAIDTLKLLHQRFYDRRINIINERREFFRVTLDEIYNAVQDIAKQTGTLTILHDEKAPQAYEYRRTQATQKRQASNIQDVYSLEIENDATA